MAIRNDLRVGFNVHAQGTGVKNFARLEQWCKDAKPSMMLVMDNPGFAQRLRALGVPIVVHRKFTEFSWYDHPVSDWFDTHEHLGDIYQALENEGGAPVEYTLQFVQHNNSLERPHRVALWNLSSGTPEADVWEQPKMLELLRLIAQTPDRYAVGVHEYVHNNSVPGVSPDDWPKNVQLAPNLYHVGRIGRLALVCQKYGIPMPPVLVTEAGTDNHGDLEKVWGKIGRGWKQAQETWRQLFPSLSAAEAFYMSLWYTACVSYANMPFVKGMAVFSYGNVNSDWVLFDCEDLPDLLPLLTAWQPPRLLTQFAGTSPAPVAPPMIVQPPPPAPQPLPAPTPSAAHKVYSVTPVGCNYVNLRAGRSVSTALVGKVYPGAVVASTGAAVNGFVDVLTVDGTAGYISATYAKFTEVSAAQWAGFKAKVGG